MKKKAMLSCVCLVGIFAVSAMADNPWWSYTEYPDGQHNITALPWQYTQVFIGSNIDHTADFMLDVSATTHKRNAISGFAMDPGFSGIYGSNENGNGVMGVSYAGNGILGEVPFGVAGPGIAGRFNHRSFGTALQVDVGKVNFLDGSSSNHNPNLTVTYTGTDAFDHIAIQASSCPQPWSGIGGDFSGGYLGIQGAATMAGSLYNVGGLFKAYNADYNYGIVAQTDTNTNDWAGWFEGKVYTSMANHKPSDAKLKKDVTKLTGAIDKVMKLNPVNFFYKTEEYSKMRLPKEKQTGLIAQELEMVFPELVCETAIRQDKDTLNPLKPKEPIKIKTVNYTPLIAVLIKAIQEQQQTIEELKKRIY